ARGISRRQERSVIGLTRGVFDGSQDVFPFKVWVIFEDLLETCAIPDKIEQIAHGDAHTASAGPAAALASSVVILLRRLVLNLNSKNWRRRYRITRARGSCARLP